MNSTQQAQPDVIRRLMIFFALVYVAEGLGQIGGLISQPLTFFLKESMHWNTAQVTEYMTVLTLPWIIKPLYGLVSDFIPLFGYRRKSYLFLSNALAVGAFLWLTGLTAPAQILVALFLTAVGMAVSSTLCGAVVVENGKAMGKSGKFVGQQWLWFAIAGIVTSLAGGWLCDYLSPDSAFHTAALITAFAPVGVMIGCLFLISEKKSKVNIQQLKATGRGLASTFKSKTLWIVAGFLAFWNFSPGFGTPLYYHMVDNLHFSQTFIGSLGAIGAVGGVLGALAFMYGLQGRLSMRALIYLSIAFGTISQGAYVLLGGSTSAILLAFGASLVSQVAFLTMLTMAAYACPSRSEGFTYAALMSILNLAGQASANIGAQLYEKVFDKNLIPLIIVSAAFTALCFLIVPLLPKFDKSGRIIGEQANECQEGSAGEAEAEPADESGTGIGADESQQITGSEESRR